jgi:hypothetical protein
MSQAGSRARYSAPWGRAGNDKISTPMIAFDGDGCDVTRTVRPGTASGERSANALTFFYCGF